MAHVTWVADLGRVIWLRFVAHAAPMPFQSLCKQRPTINVFLHPGGTCACTDLFPQANGFILPVFSPSSLFRFLCCGQLTAASINTAPLPLFCHGCCLQLAVGMHSLSCFVVSTGQIVCRSIEDCLFGHTALLPKRLDGTLGKSAVFQQFVASGLAWSAAGLTLSPQPTCRQSSMPSTRALPEGPHPPPAWQLLMPARLVLTITHVHWRQCSEWVGCCTQPACSATNQPAGWCFLAQARFFFCWGFCTGRCTAGLLVLFAGGCCTAGCTACWCWFLRVHCRSAVRCTSIANIIMQQQLRQFLPALVARTVLP